MNLTLALITPWRCGHRSLRWLSVIIFLLCAVGAAGTYVLVPANHTLIASIPLLIFGLIYAWSFFFPNTLLLAIDARALRIPGIERQVVVSLLLYGLIGIVPAAVILGTAGSNMLNIGALLLLATVAGFGFALLPRYIGMCAGVVPALVIGLHHSIQLPGPTSPRFVLWAVPAAIAILLVNAVRWRQLLRADNPLQQGLRSAMVMQYRHRGAWSGCGGWGAIGSTDLNSMIRNRPDWMQPGADLRKVGPRWPVRALRVALGGWYVPRTLTGQLRSLTPVLLPLLLFIPVMLLIQIGNDGVSATLWRVAGILVVTWIGIFGSIMLAVVGVLSLRRRWTRVNGELPLLALLPGLGSTHAIKRDLLRASLLQPLGGLVVLLVLVLGAAWAIHIRGPSLIAITLAVLGCGGATVAMMLNTLGGRPLPMWLVGLGLALVFALLCISLFLPVTEMGRHAWHAGPLVIRALIDVWLLLGLGMAWLARRGWRQLVQRPHAFLVNRQ